MSSRVIRSVNVERPIDTVYNQWTQFEEFPLFMKGVEKVIQLDGSHAHWVAEIAGQRREWDAVIEEEWPDSHITWHGFGDVDLVGTVSFMRTDLDRTRVTAVIEFEPSNVAEKLGDALGFVEARIQGDLTRFKEFIEERAEATGAWRGTITQGNVRSASA